MPQRGVTASFSDELANILKSLATAKIAPDADMDFIGEMESQILERLKPSQQADPMAALQASMGAGGQPPGGPGPAPVPMTPAPTRIPGTSPDLREATAALEAGLGGTA